MQQVKVEIVSPKASEAPLTGPLNSVPCHVSRPDFRHQDYVFRLTRNVATASQQQIFSRNLRLGDYVLRTRPQQRLEAATPGIRWCNKNKNTRENDYGNGHQTSA